MVGLIAAVFDKCEELNTAKTESSMTILMLDEALAFAVDNVCDYTQLAKLDKYSTLHSVICINPRAEGDGSGVFTVALPENCSVPCIKGSGHGCMASAQLNIGYHNSSQIRQFFQFRQDHGSGLLTRDRENDK